MRMEERKRISRMLLRGMRKGEQVTVVCQDGYDQQSQMNIAYQTGRLEGCRFSCRTDGLTLTVTREGAN